MENTTPDRDVLARDPGQLAKLNEIAYNARLYTPGEFLHNVARRAADVKPTPHAHAVKQPKV